jgi:hypothetical protein
MFLTIVANLLMGTEKDRAHSGTYGRAETSNNPITALGRGEFFSRYGYCTIEEQPEPNGAKTPLASA